jgi:hypothetical protein
MCTVVSIYKYIYIYIYIYKRLCVYIFNLRYIAKLYHRLSFDTITYVVYFFFSVLPRTITIQRRLHDTENRKLKIYISSIQVHFFLRYVCRIVHFPFNVYETMSTIIIIIIIIIFFISIIIIIIIISHGSILFFILC